ncbi:hypothetical protein BT93_H1402 [Corymbia citriodora subsp. variegata]|nr:hypothetical protein BT93_H1402 [Corymbia citriodora subsp. variegata]
MSLNHSLNIFTIRCKHALVCTSMCSSITGMRISEFLFLISLLISCHHLNNFNHHSMLSNDL